MGLNLEQQRAVEYLEGPLLVLAGPGTGKTQLLSAKVAYILEKLDTRPENILCLTFTEAGAQNMRDRLQSMIGKDALNVNIHTYHAFGSDILGRYKNYAENFDRRLDAPIDETAQYRMINDIQKSLPTTDIMKSAEVKQIIEVISHAKSARLTAADLQKIAEANIEQSRELSEKITPYFEALPKRAKFDIAMDGTYQPILDLLSKVVTPEPIVGNVECLANVLAKDLYRVVNEATAEEKPKVSKLNKWRDQNFEKSLRDPRDPESICYRLKDYIRNKKLLSVAHIMAQYEQKLEELGLFDFSDMIECAIKFLKEDCGFCMQMSELFQYILLDEFQDTNTSQFELIKLLTDYEKPNIMAVGDDDQAIYEFQGANYSNLQEFREYYKAEVITLRDNYRSTGEVLHLAKELAGQIEDSFAKNYKIDKTLRSMKDVWAGDSGEKIVSRVRRHEFPGRAPEYYWVANEIYKLLKDGVEPNDIAIIAPQHKSLVSILPYLKAKNIDVVYEKRDNLLQDEKMSMLITLAKFIDRLSKCEQPAEKLFEILSYEFWQVPADVAVRAIERKRGQEKSLLEYLAGDPQLEQIGKFFADLAAAATTAPLEMWMDYLIGTLPLNGYTSPFLSYYQEHSSEAELLEFYENLSTFRQKTLSHAANLSPNIVDYTPRLADFVRTIEDFEFAGTPIMRMSIYRDSAKAIQVMTAHKSKGLEFKYVFLISVDDRCWGKAEGNNNQLALPKNVEFIRHTGITDDEKLRLFFVAVTRAKDALIMTNSRAKDDGGKIMRLRYLSESSYEDSEHISPYLNEDVQEIWMHDDDLSVEERIETMRLSWVSAYQKLQPNTLDFLRERMNDYRLSATDVTKFIDLSYAGPQEAYRTCVLHAPSEPATFSMHYGTALHRVFKQITDQKITDEEALEVFRNEVNSNISLTAEDKRDLLEKGEHSLKIALKEFSQILRHDGAKAEVNFYSEKLNLNGIPLSGAIDHLEIDPKAKTIEVYDYKTGTYHDDKWNSLMSLYKYRLQLGFYKILLNLSPTYRNYKVTRGHILFVTPDADERVYDKIYEYNDAEEQELKDIMAAVYYQLRSLDFVNDEELFIPAEANITKNKNLEFIKKLIEKTPADNKYITK